MYGLLALLIAIAAPLGGYFLRLDVLTTRPYVLFALAGLAVLLAIVQFRVRGSLSARIAAVLAIVAALAFQVALPFATSYGETRGEGPPLGASLAGVELRSSDGGDPVRLDAAPRGTLLVFLRGFW
jgi:hypothetical protein